MFKWHSAFLNELLFSIHVYDSGIVYINFGSGNSLYWHPEDLHVPQEVRQVIQKVLYR